MATKSIAFKCPKCKHTWSIIVDEKAHVTARQKCPACRKYSDDCLGQFYNPWAGAFAKKKEEEEKEEETTNSSDGSNI